MTTSRPARIAPAVQMRRHSATSWPVSERAALADRLAVLGLSITECSDALETAGLPRLSSASADARRDVWRWALTPEGERAVTEARALRAMYVEALASIDRHTVAEARHCLGLRRASPSCLRLNELRSVYAMSRALELS